MRADPRIATPTHDLIRSWVLVGFLALSIFSLVSGPVYAQERDSSLFGIDGATKPQFSVGLLAGPTSGLGLKALFRAPTAETPGRSSDLHLSFNGEGFAQISGHTLQERLLPDAPLILYMGPGMIAELDDGTLRWGLSGVLGAYFVKGPYEVLLQLMPRMLITPERNGGYSAAIGLRYRF